MAKTFSELTTDEAKDIVGKIVRSSKSEDEIRHRLSEAGFNGEDAAISSQRCGPMFQAMLLVWGPRGEIISV
jgi:hypothetical protein